MLRSQGNVPHLILPEEGETLGTACEMDIYRKNLTKSLLEAILPSLASFGVTIAVYVYSWMLAENLGGLLPRRKSSHTGEGCWGASGATEFQLHVGAASLLWIPVAAS